MQQPPNDQPPFTSYPPQLSQPLTPPPSPAYPYGAPMPAPQPPKKKRRVWAWVIGILVVLIVISAIASAAGGNTTKTSIAPTPTTQASSQPTHAAQPTPTATPTLSGHKVGEPVMLNGWAVTVNGVKTSQGSDFNQPQHSGDIFLWVDVTVENHTGSSQTVSSLGQFSLKDESGQTYNETIDSDAPASPDGDLANGKKLRGTLVYEVPGATKTVEFDFTPDAFGSDQASWQLSV